MVFELLLIPSMFVNVEDLRRGSIEMRPICIGIGGHLVTFLGVCVPRSNVDSTLMRFEFLPYKLVVMMICTFASDEDLSSCSIQWCLIRAAVFLNGLGGEVEVLVRPWLHISGTRM